MINNPVSSITSIFYNNPFGYYVTKQPFGLDGDFITSPKVSNLFSEIIAIWLISTWENFGRLPKGLILLQDHGDEVAYKNIKLREF